MISPILLAAGVSTLAAAALTPVVGMIARRYGYVALPKEDRWHESPTALHGGIAIFFACLAGAVLLLAAGVTDHLGLVSAVMVASTLMFLVGVADDRFELTPVTKFVLQVGAAVLLISLGVIYPLTAWGPVNVLLTVFWFVGLTNAFNLLDNMDGVATGIAGIVASTFAILFWSAGAPLLGILAAALAGSCGGFLIYNFKPASIFMGDSGSLFIGSLLAGLALAYILVEPAPGAITPLLPILILSLPIVDTTLVTITRVVNYRPISQGGRDHTTHRLVAMGFSERQTACVLYGLAAISGLMALILRNSEPYLGGFSVALFIVGLGLFAGYLARLHRYEGDGDPDSYRIGTLFRHLLYQRRGLEVVLDTVLFGLAWYGAFLLYYDGAIPASHSGLVNISLAVVVLAKLAAFNVLRVYRGTWQQASVADLHRLAKATLLGSLLAVTTLFVILRSEDIPRTVFVLDGLLAGCLALSSRASVRSFNRLRRRLNPRRGRPTLIYGTSESSELAHRAIETNPDLGLCVIGFLAAHRHEAGQLVHGLRVNGTGDLEKLRQKGLAVVLLTSEVPEQTAAMVQTECAAHGLRCEVLKVVLEPIELVSSEAERLRGEEAIALYPDVRPFVKSDEPARRVEGT